MSTEQKKFPVLSRYRIEVCPDELTGVWHDSGMTPDNFAQAKSYIEGNVPKHVMSRIVFDTMTVLKVYYSPPSYLR